MQLLGVTNRWYHELSLMFWAGASEGTPTLAQRPSTDCGIAVAGADEPACRPNRRG
jgi:hypothetical protein